MKTIAIHRTYEQSKAFNRDIVLYRSGDKPLKGIENIGKWVKTIKKGQVIRTTYVNSTDILLLDIADRGVKLLNAHWHSTGLAEGLSPQEIVDKYASLDEAIFRVFKPRADIAALRRLIDIRRAVVEERKKAVQRVKGVLRGQGMTEESQYDDFSKKWLSRANKMLAQVDDDESKQVDWLTDLDKEIAKAAEKINECILFNSIAHIKGSWGSAATVVALSGGIDRFETVAALWHYCGEHVKDGKAPKRKAGEASDWNARLRTTLWQMGDSIMKNRKNPWRSFFDRVRAEELAAHDKKCNQLDGKPCKHPDGHSTARAQRKMRKEILKRFFLACQSTPYEKNHRSQPPTPKSMSAAAD